MIRQILVSLIFTTVLFCKDTPNQTPWSVLNIKGHSIDPATGKIDDTEGFGAFDSIMQLFKPHCPTNFDNGGGSFDDNTKYLKEKYQIENVVYDPYMRSLQHNKKVIDDLKNKKFDCSTSISVLNVIDKLEARKTHITLCFDVLKENGTSFFKVWPGNGTGTEVYKKDSYQSNKSATFYIDEIKKVFGQNNVELVDKNTIKAIKKLK